jgi:TPR repeat protein
MSRLVLLFVVLALPGAAARADFNDGVVALTMGKYAEALETFVPLAETSNHAYAQYFLGRMYASGQGVEPDQKAAAEWYRKAAEQGVADAQYRLGALYEKGEGVPRDMEYAYGWYSVAAHLDNAHGDEGLARARAQLSERELVEADKLSRELIKKYGVVPRSTARTQ